MVGGFRCRSLLFRLWKPVRRWLLHPASLQWVLGGPCRLLLGFPEFGSCVCVFKFLFDVTSTFTYVRTSFSGLRRCVWDCGDVRVGESLRRACAQERVRVGVRFFVRVIR